LHFFAEFYIIFVVLFLLVVLFLFSFPEFFHFSMGPKSKPKPHYSVAPQQAHELFVPQQADLLERQQYFILRGDIIQIDHFMHRLAPLVAMCVFCGMMGFLVALLGWGSSLSTGCV